MTQKEKPQVHYAGSKIYLSPPYLENRVVTLFYIDDDAPADSDGNLVLRVIWKGFFNDFKTNDSQTAIQIEAVDYISKLLDVDCGSTNQLRYPTESFFYKDVDGKIRLQGSVLASTAFFDNAVNPESHPGGANMRAYKVDDWIWYFRRRADQDWEVTGDALYDIYPDDKEINTILSTDKTFREMVFVDRYGSDPNRWASTFRAAAVEPQLRQAPDFDGIRRAQLRPMDVSGSADLIGNVPQSGWALQGNLIQGGFMTGSSLATQGNLVDDGSGRLALYMDGTDNISIDGLDIVSSNGITFLLWPDSQTGVFIKVYSGVIMELMDPPHLLLNFIQTATQPPHTINWPSPTEQVL